MPHLLLANSTDLESWSDRRTAQADLPRLVRRLIHVTGTDLELVSFRAHEGIQLRGWDGIVRSGASTAFIPAGTSGWEMSTAQNIENQADINYTKRTKESGEIDPGDSTFIFVTPRRWPRKEAWIASRREEGIWRDVRAYDSDDLEPWLETAPSVHIWFSVLSGVRIDGARDLDSFWEGWSQATNPHITTDLVLSGRQETIDKIHNWLHDPAQSVALQADSPEVATAIFAAALNRLSDDLRYIHFSNTIVVQNELAWSELTASTTPMILIPLFGIPDSMPPAGSVEHKVFIPLGLSDYCSENTIRVPRLSRQEAKATLEAAGLPEERASQLATLARRSFATFRRTIATSPAIQQPAWAKPSVGPALVPALLAGAWNEAYDGDRQILAELAQVPYSEFIEVIIHWANENDPPMRRIGDTWYLNSGADSWSLLSRYFTREYAERFSNQVKEALGSPDPRYELPEEQQWMASVLGHSPRYSKVLRKNLAETLALMGAFGRDVQISTGFSAERLAAQLVSELLGRANEDWHVWASLERLLPLLAEAAPEEFLARADQGMIGSDPVIRQLFRDQESTAFADSPHTGLLWALESLAWSTEYLARASVLLAKLARLDPGGRLANRPIASLRGIFLCWYPQTSADLDQRLQVIDTIREREEEIGWQLMSSLLPKNQDIGHNSLRPTWRDWAPESALRPSRSEHFQALTELVPRMISAADEIGERWSDLVDALPVLPPEQFEAVLTSLEGMDLDQLGRIHRVRMWDAMRELISHHRSFPDAKWSMNSDRIDRINVLFNLFEPEEPIDRYSWLFDYRPQLPEGNDRDHNKRQEAINGYQIDAVGVVNNNQGLAGIMELGRNVKEPFFLGVSLVHAELIDGQEVEFLGEHLCSPEAYESKIANGYAVGLVERYGRDWFHEFIKNSLSCLSVQQLGELPNYLPPDRPTWDLVEKLPAEAQEHYWRRMRPYGIAKLEDLEYVVDHLLKHRRPYTAVDTLAMAATSAHDVPINLAADALEALLITPEEEDTHLQTFSFHIAELLDFLTASEELPSERIARLEWSYLPILDREGTQTLTLHQELACNPAFFVEILSLAYRAEDEEPHDLSAEDQEQAQRAHELLGSWQTIPGTSGDGVIDHNELNEWMEKALTISQECGRRDIAEEVIGSIVSSSPIGPDEIWPHPAVRDLIEKLESEPMERGFHNGLYNRRGVVTKNLFEGGSQERELMERYVSFAEALQDEWPRTASILRRIAEGYRSEANREDNETDLREDIGL